MRPEARPAFDPHQRRPAAHGFPLNGAATLERQHLGERVLDQRHRPRLSPPRRSIHHAHGAWPVTASRGGRHCGSVRRRSAMLDITCSANIGVSWTRKRNVLRSITASLVSVTATTVALRGEESTIAISPNVSSGPSLRTAPLGSRTSTSPSTMPNISVPLAPASKIGVPAGTSWKVLAFRNRPGSFIPNTSVASRVRLAQANPSDALTGRRRPARSALPRAGLAGTTERRQSAGQRPGRGQQFGLRVGDDAGRALALDLVDNGVGSQAVGAVPVYERVATSAASDRIGSRRRDRGKASPWVLTLRTP